MHDDQHRAEARADCGELGIGEARDVVHDRRPERQRPLGDLGAARVDRHERAARHRGSHGALDALDLLPRRDGLGARAGRLAPDIDDVGSFSHELDHAIGDRSSVRVAAAVVERVGRRVEDAHERSTPLSTGLLDSERDGSHMFALASEAASGKHEVADFPRISSHSRWGARGTFREGLEHSDDEAASDPIGEPRRDFTLDTRGLVVAQRARDFAGVAQTHTSSQGVEQRKGARRSRQ